MPTHRSRSIVPPQYTTEDVPENDPPPYSDAVEVAPGVTAWTSTDHIVIDTTRELVLNARQALYMSGALAALARLIEQSHGRFPHR